MVSDPYKVFNLPHTATVAQIKRAYHQLAKKYHPDTWSQPCFNDVEKKRATAKFAEISGAYALLMDEQRKAEYDRTYQYGGYGNNNDDGGGGDDDPESQKQKPNPTRTPHASSTAAPPPRPSSPPTAAPPPRPPQQPQHPQRDMYYYMQHATTADDYNNNSSSYGRMQEDARYASRRPDNHQCDAVCSLVLCPPIGLIALYHSISVDRCWQQGFYGDAINHARQAPKYACLGNMVGIVFWIYWLFVRDGSRFEWPDLDFDFEG